MSIKFEWNPDKAAKNLRKHKVSFEEAATVFRDALSMTVPDPDHSTEKDRHITVGLSSRSRLLMVSHTDWEERIRIISARQLTHQERKDYEEGNWD